VGGCKLVFPTNYKLNWHITRGLLHHNRAIQALKAYSITFILFTTCHKDKAILMKVYYITEMTGKQ